MNQLSKFRVLINLFAILTHTVNCADNFNKLFEAIWAPDHITTQGNQAALSLDPSSGCGFESKKKYSFGKISARLKLVPGNSAGTITAYYMVSEGPNRDELDFEFLGNVSGQPYVMQTNLYINGTGNREQRYYLWFDPTVDFHTYSFFWNRRTIVFLVDDIPIREFRNKKKKGVPYPKNQAMVIHGSLWDGDDWATRGGRVKTNWSDAPFVATFQSFDIDACDLSSGVDPSVKCGKSRRFRRNKPVAEKKRRKQLKWVRDHFLIYDYCQDVARFGVGMMPRECTC